LRRWLPGPRLRGLRRRRMFERLLSRHPRRLERTQLLPPRSARRRRSVSRHVRHSLMHLATLRWRRRNHRNLQRELHLVGACTAVRELGLLRLHVSRGSGVRRAHGGPIRVRMPNEPVWRQLDHVRLRRHALRQRNLPVDRRSHGPLRYLSKQRVPLRGQANPCFFMRCINALREMPSRFAARL
jgi:hypothetical protein